MDYTSVEALRERHAAWRLLRAGNAPLILSFLGGFFVEANRGACPACEIASVLDDELYELNAITASEDVVPRYPREPRQYLEDWAAPETGYLRRFYPPGDDEVHYEITPAFAKAHLWIASLQERSFVGTESRLHTVVELLRQIAHGTEPDPESRLVELRRRRAELEIEIAAVEAGEVAVLDEAGVRDRYQQLSAVTRELLSDFREVEENLRRLDRASRERIAAWRGSKGELLEELIEGRSEISGTDQDRSFQAFHEFLLSQGRQDELTALLSRVSRLPAVDPDPRIRGIHHDWAEAAERAQRTVRQISEQLRRFLDDQVCGEPARAGHRARRGGRRAAGSLPPAGIWTGGLRYRDRAGRAVRASLASDSSLGRRGRRCDRRRRRSRREAAVRPDLHRPGASPRQHPKGASALLSDIVEVNPIEQGWPTVQLPLAGVGAGFVVLNRRLRRRAAREGQAWASLTTS